ncbi:hypothetical protein F2Q69_00008794 [Brassica cretica]|uniref:Uncharacterized protein n=1 Tax=Brassica cretica TaxID=69181 RepID=A0A8S9P8A9_BRACR|nr:hypothetical protein F2Q69_00008794 [Brassica cretica]
MHPCAPVIPQIYVVMVFWPAPSPSSSPIIATSTCIGFIFSRGFAVYRSVFFVRVAVRWMYTVPVECNGDGNLRRKPLNDGIVGPRLLLVPPVVSSSVPGFGARPWIL